ncbi:unnamed protein product [Cylicostephanus goldi]|uniref:Uncharacterized protein n=1 Tax=Cylicostephanus goldi TaxID=71465 RepID=A0A3P6QNZ7_CYLGO|nr:unnamed protein product [Cylicostephanus goldi]
MIGYGSELVQVNFVFSRSPFQAVEVWKILPQYRNRFRGENRLGPPCKNPRTSNASGKGTNSNFERGTR